MGTELTLPHSSGRARHKSSLTNTARVNSGMQIMSHYSHATSWMKKMDKGGFSVSQKVYLLVSLGRGGLGDYSCCGGIKNGGLW